MHTYHNYKYNFAIDIQNNMFTQDYYCYYKTCIGPFQKSPLLIEAAGTYYISTCTDYHPAKRRGLHYYSLFIFPCSYFRNLPSSSSLITALYFNFLDIPDNPDPLKPHVVKAKTHTIRGIPWGYPLHPVGVQVAHLDQPSNVCIGSFYSFQVLCNLCLSRNLSHQ